jgi:hypothetical protein
VCIAITNSETKSTTSKTIANYASPKKAGGRHVVQNKAQVKRADPAKAGGPLQSQNLLAHLHGGSLSVPTENLSDPQLGSG